MLSRYIPYPAAAWFLPIRADRLDIIFVQGLVNVAMRASRVASLFKLTDAASRWVRRGVHAQANSAVSTLFRTGCDTRHVPALLTRRVRNAWCLSCQAHLARHDAACSDLHREATHDP